MPLPNLAYHTINAFAPTPHGGNQAAVVLVPKDDPRAKDDKYMLTVAADFNLSETAYLVPLDDATVPVYSLRWFTPEIEVPLCGHATLASAATLFNYVHPEATELRFQTRWRGELRAYRESETGQGVSIALDLPISPVQVVDNADENHIVAAGSGLQVGDIIQTAEFDFGGPALVVQVKDTVDVGKLHVAPRKLLEGRYPMVVITQVVADKAQKAGSVRAHSRVLAPSAGIDEDPVTGSAWAVLTGYYLSGVGAGSVEALVPEGTDVTKIELDAHQFSPRGGALTCSLRDGRAYIVGRGWRTGWGQLESFE